MSIFLFIAISTQLSAQKQKYVVIHTSKRYISARLVAEQASKLLGIELNLRGLQEHPTQGLTLSRSDCNKQAPPQPYPYYPLRDNRDNGVFLSVEYSSAYKSWAKGFFLVIVASDSASDNKLNETLQKVKQFYGDAYIKQCD